MHSTQGTGPSLLIAIIETQIIVTSVVLSLGASVKLITGVRSPAQRRLLVAHGQWGSNLNIIPP